ncbi:NADP-dependent oxidoreductase domain-containing protein [Sporodiniella umbellata]|nr:NADP-dependent oxidoreductase domain-containing protein [Sporodiniella umbellata]
MSSVPKVKLSSGYEFPLIGFGTFGGHDSPEKVYDATKVALEKGYRHIDTAYIYKTEEAVGKAIQESNVDRQDLFVTTKLWQTFHRAEHVGPALDRSLKLLGLDYIDLYLIHWPFAWEFEGYEFDQLNPKEPKILDLPLAETWKAMEKLVKDGKARSIGVSNFTIPMLKDLLAQCEIPPAVNQVELHPTLPQEELVDFCREHNIVLTAYSPLGNPGYRDNTYKVLEDPVVLKLAEKYQRTPHQVVLNFGINRGYAVIPKSSTPSRIEDNLVHFGIDPEDIKTLTAIGDKHPLRTV